MPNTREKNLVPTHSQKAALRPEGHPCNVGECVQVGRVDAAWGP